MFVFMLYGRVAVIVGVPSAWWDSLVGVVVVTVVVSVSMCVA